MVREGKLEPLLVGASGVATILSILLSMNLIYRHLKNYTNPSEQNFIIIIILMAPIFAINCCLGIFFVHEEDYIGQQMIPGNNENLMQQLPEWVDIVLDSFKECYEAVVIWAFLRLMFSYMKIPDTNHIPENLQGKHIHQTVPFKYFVKDFEFNSKSAARLELLAFQFVYLRPFISILRMVLQLRELHQEPWVSISITVLLNLSLALAMYALMLFYHAFEKELNIGKQRPLAKFLSIKGVVAFAFWQGMIIKLLISFGFFELGKFCNNTEQKTVYQEFLVCLEMGLLFSPLQYYAFTDFSYHEKKKEKSE